MTELKRAHVPSTSLLRPGEYMAILNAETWTLYKCPSCGFVVSITRANHSVDYQGYVTPHVSCPHKTPTGTRCNFYDLILLVDWVPEAKGEA